MVGLSIRQSPSAGCQLEQLMGREAVRLAGDPDETGLFQRRQVARREEVRTPDPECCAQFGGTLRAVGQLARRRDVNEDVEVVGHEAVRKDLDAGKGGRAPEQVDEARALVFRQEERTMRDPTDQLIAPVGAEMSPFPHAA